MGRLARKAASSDFYHIVTRGSGKQILFEGDADKSAFMDCLREGCSASDVSIIAWCLMSNHVHLVLRGKLEDVSKMMHGLLVRFARRYNARSGHAGPVFQERFSSFPLEGEDYLLEAVRYVHNNPAKAGICPADEYGWSSYGEYVGTPEYVSADLVLEMLGGPDRFAEFCQAAPGVPYFAGRGGRVPDEDAVEVASAALGMHPGDVKALPRPLRDDALRRLRERRFTIKQIERLTGVGRGIISRA